MNPTWRYWAFQVPGILAVSAVLFSLYSFEVLDGPMCLLLFALWIIKDALLFPVLRDAYRGEKSQGKDALIGQRGKLESELNPAGWVRLRGELWQARIAQGDRRLPRGETVEVVRVERLVLYVERVAEETEMGATVYDEDDSY